MPQRLVVCESDGAAVRTSIHSKPFSVFLASARLRAIRFHDLRHSHTTLHLATGTNTKVDSERPGYSIIVLTLNTYPHVLPTMQEEAAANVTPFLRWELKPIRLKEAS